MSLVLLSTNIAQLRVPSIPKLSELKCMAANVYYEARGESKAGQIAVAKVVINRTKLKGFPKTMCGVIYQKNQFSWTNTYAPIKYTFNEINNVIEAYNSTDNFKATHYHNTTVQPSWSKRLKQGVTIGRHTFYYQP